MSQVESIRQKYIAGEQVTQICREENVDYKTVKKYINKDDFSEALPVKVERPKKTDEYAKEIEQLLLDNKDMWRKQQLTSKRIYDILKDKHPEFSASYDCVNRFVQVWKKQHKSTNNLGFSHLVWHPGEAQADFGEADVKYYGGITRFKYFVLSFPQANMAFMQFFQGENCECVCHGLQDIFYYIGGVPHTIIFDNATGIGKRISNILTENEMFVRFRLHYGFTSRFCNPYAGHEKGSVESNVGYLRRNLLTPLIEVSKPMSEFNSQELFQKCQNLMSKRTHYIHNVLVTELFENDKKALFPLPKKKFEARRILTPKTDNYSNVTLEGIHKYTLPPEYANKQVIVETWAWKVTVSDITGNRIEEFDRVYGQERSESIKPALGLCSLSRKPGSWINSSFRKSLSPDNAFRTYIDSLQETEEKHKIFTQFHKALDTFTFDIVLQAFSQMAEKKIDMTSKSNVETLCTRLESFPADFFNNPTGVDLNQYQILMEH